MLCVRSFPCRWTRRGVSRVQVNGQNLFGLSRAHASARLTGAELALLMNAENTYLSWSRNCLIATSAGLFIIHYNAQYGGLQRMPISGVGILLLGGIFMLTGSFSYIRTNKQLARIMHLSMSHWIWVTFQACCPQIIWFFSMRCFLFGTPEPIVHWISENQDNPNLPPFLKNAAPSTSRRLEMEKASTK